MESADGIQQLLGPSVGVYLRALRQEGVSRYRGEQHLDLGPGKYEALLP